MRSERFDFDTLKDIRGFNSYHTMALIDILARLVEPQTSLEIGTWEGKTSCIIGASTTGSFHYVECNSTNYYKTRINVQEHTSLPAECIVGHKNMSQYTHIRQTYERCMGFIHIDGAHSLEAVKHDLDMCLNILNSEGLIILDDAFTPAYPQITQALYEFLAQHSEVKLVLVGMNKAVICFNRYYSYYSDFIATSLLDEMKKYPNVTDVCLCKTTNVIDCPTYGLIIDPTGSEYRGDECVYDYDVHTDFNIIERINREERR